MNYLSLNKYQSNILYLDIFPLHKHQQTEVRLKLYIKIVVLILQHVWVMNAKDYHQISPLIIYRYYDKNCLEYILTFKIELDS